MAFPLGHTHTSVVPGSRPWAWFSFSQHFKNTVCLCMWCSRRVSRTCHNICVELRSEDFIVELLSPDFTWVPRTKLLLLGSHNKGLYSETVQPAFGAFSVLLTCWACCLLPGWHPCTGQRNMLVLSKGQLSCLSWRASFCILLFLYAGPYVLRQTLVTVSICA